MHSYIFRLSAVSCSDKMIEVPSKCKGNKKKLKKNFISENNFAKDTMIT